MDGDHDRAGYKPLSWSTKAGKSLLSGWVCVPGSLLVSAKTSVAVKASAMATAGKSLVEPAMGPEKIIRFFADHPYGTEESPYEFGLPEDYPDSCAFSPKVP